MAKVLHNGNQPPPRPHSTGKSTSTRRRLRWCVSSAMCRRPEASASPQAGEPTSAGSFSRSLQQGSVPPDVSLMPESFVQPAPLKVEPGFWSRRIRWGCHGSSAARRDPPLPGRQPTAWLLLWRLDHRRAGLLWLRSHVRHRGADGVAPALWPLPGHGMDLGRPDPGVPRPTSTRAPGPGGEPNACSSTDSLVAGFFLASGILEWILGVATGVGTSGLDHAALRVPGDPTARLSRHRRPGLVGTLLRTLPHP